MVIQNKSIEGAYDKAIEDAAGRIHEASRPQRSNSSTLSNTIKNVEDTSRGNIIIAGEKNSKLLSLQLPDHHKFFDEICALGSDNSISTVTGDSHMDDEDIVSNLLFLEEKKRILKKAKIRNEKEEAYIAVNAHDISNRREPCSRCVGSSSIWSEARQIIEKFKISGEKESGCEGDEERFQDFVPSSIEGQEKTSSSSDPTSESCSPTLPLSSPPSSSRTTMESYVEKISSTRKRPIIDLSMVRQVSSAEFSKECFEKEVDLTRTEYEDDDKCIH
jgi:hypothetical protein